MYIHTQTHVHTTQTHVRTYTQTHTHIHVHTCRHMYRYTHAHTHRHMYTCIHRCTQTCTRTPPPIKSCSTSLFTHRSGYCTLGGGREHSTHSLLCFHCAQLLSSLTASSANDRSGLSSEPALGPVPGGTHSPPP
ncbi:unnamed protein product [Staurois parvus]|uniref:Uncharacterized protein n=1 Tax=Staurois parvus TaxID=386267 RepID=A0ABN9G074_9NEOB|nr:unnamed protein product [Staurois parvus]